MWVAPVVHIQVGVPYAMYIDSHLGSTISIQVPSHQRKLWLTTIFGVL
jgi:hypothetical protein